MGDGGYTKGRSSCFAVGFREAQQDGYAGRRIRMCEFGEFLAGWPNDRCHRFSPLLPPLSLPKEIWIERGRQSCGRNEKNPLAAFLFLFMMMTPPSTLPARRCPSPAEAFRMLCRNFTWKMFLKYVSTPTAVIFRKHFPREISAQPVFSSFQCM